MNRFHFLAGLILLTLCLWACTGMTLVSAQTLRTADLHIQVTLPSTWVVDSNYRSPGPLYQERPGGGYQKTDYMGQCGSVGPGMPPFWTMGFNGAAKGDAAARHRDLAVMFIPGQARTSTGLLGGRSVLVSKSADGTRQLFSLTDSLGTRFMLVRGNDPTISQFLSSVKFL